MQQQQLEEKKPMTPYYKKTGDCSSLSFAALQFWVKAEKGVMGREQIKQIVLWLRPFRTAPSMPFSGEHSWVSELLLWSCWNHFLNLPFKKIFGQTESHISSSCASISFCFILFQSVLTNQVTPQNYSGCSAKTQKCYQAESQLLIHSLTRIYWLFQWYK